MPTLPRRVVITEILRQAIPQAVFGGEQIEHGVDPRDFRAFVSGEITVQFQAQRLRIEVALEQAVDLGRLLAFQLDPALLLELIQGLDHPVALSLVPQVQRVEIDRDPSSRAA
jgi:hypothetical protein